MRDALCFLAVASAARCAWCARSACSSRAACSSAQCVRSPSTPRAASSCTASFSSSSDWISARRAPVTASRSVKSASACVRAAASCSASALSCDASACCLSMPRLTASSDRSASKLSAVAACASNAEFVDASAPSTEGLLRGASSISALGLLGASVTPTRCCESIATCAFSSSFSPVSTLLAARNSRNSSTTSAKVYSERGANDAKSDVIRRRTPAP
mmetsp:Transcript_58966/g.135220  ORF Transcript_58966/g.135220 Transcript_58966/m.135220 type:complete len:217 (+) Transcript_58966:366-1016(+)